MIASALCINPGLFFGASWDMPCALPPLSLGIGSGGWGGGPCSMPVIGKDGSLRGQWLPAAETLLLLSLLCDPSLPLFSSPVLASARALPATPMFGAALCNFESRTEKDSLTGASSPCLPCCRGLIAYPGVLQWLFCTFCCYSDKLNSFHGGFF